MSVQGAFGLSVRGVSLSVRSRYRVSMQSSSRLHGSGAGL